MPTDTKEQDHMATKEKREKYHIQQMYEQVHTPQANSLEILFYKRKKNVTVLSPRQPRIVVKMIAKTTD